MALPPLRYVDTAVSIVFQQPLVALPTADVGPFIRDPNASTPAAAMFRTMTGHSFLQIESFQARLQTQYSGRFTEPNAVAERVAYADEKVASLLQLLQTISAVPTFLGVVVSARLTPPDDELKHFRETAARACGVNPLLTEGHDAWDFMIRGSRAHGADLFSNLQAQWFQVRQIDLKLTPEHLAQGVQVREWDGIVTSEGLQLTLDRNNKRGLYAGKCSWSDAEFVKMACGAVEDAAAAFGPLLVALQHGENNG